MNALDLRNPWPGAPILYLESTGSTMEEALALARLDYPSGTTVVADYQEAGRGRVAGRRWNAAAGKNLLFTLILRAGRAQAPPFRLPLLVGLAVARALESSFGLEPVIKWPNDVLCRLPAPTSRSGPAGSRGGGGTGSGGAFLGSGGAFLGKTAGILCEALIQGEELVLLAGVGVNCNQRGFSGDRSAVSLLELLGRDVDRLRLLEGILAEIRQAIEDREWKRALLQRLFLLGREVTVRVGLPDVDPPERVSGVLAGLQDDGALQIRTPGGRVIAVHSGELEKGF